MNIKAKGFTETVSTNGTLAVTRVDGSPLPARLDLVSHAACSMWGDGGPGAAQLALALLADGLDDEARALTWYQDFKWYVVARLPAGRGWTLDGAYIRKIAHEPSHGVRNRPI